VKSAPGLVVSLLAVVFVSLVAAQWQGRQHVDDILVTGATGLSGSSVRAMVDTLMHKQARALSLADIREMVEKHPYVRSATVVRTGVHEITVDVQERMPVAHMVMTGGDLRYVDADGTILPPAQVRMAHNVPVIQSLQRTPLTNSDVQAIAAMLVSASTRLDPVLYQSVSEVRYDAKRRTASLVTDNATWRIDVHDADATVRGFADMNVFWKQAGSRMNMAAVDVIDLRWNHQVILRYKG
jgi:cell division septal protein FtsQ